MSGITEGPVWETPAETAVRLRKHPRTVQKAATCGELHSHQRRPNGRRSIVAAVADVWNAGGSEADQRRACLATCAPAARVRRIA